MQRQKQRGLDSSTACVFLVLTAALSSGLNSLRLAKDLLLSSMKKVIASLSLTGSRLTSAVRFWRSSCWLGICGERTLRNSRRSLLSGKAAMITGRISLVSQDLMSSLPASESLSRPRATRSANAAALQGKYKSSHKYRTCKYNNKASVCRGCNCTIASVRADSLTVTN